MELAFLGKHSFIWKNNEKASKSDSKDLHPDLKIILIHFKCFVQTYFMPIYLWKATKV